MEANPARPDHVLVIHWLLMDTNMNKDEALRLALEALESTGENNGYHGVTQYFDETMVDQAITAIKAALEAKDEPVAWMHVQGNHEEPSLRQLNDWEIQNGWKQYPLYTTPPQRKPLTEEKFKHMPELFVVPPHHVEMVVRAIEAAHGIKGEV
jgi:hypothetical protein